MCEQEIYRISSPQRASWAPAALWIFKEDPLQSHPNSSFRSAFHLTTAPTRETFTEYWKWRGIPADGRLHKKEADTKGRQIQHASRTTWRQPLTIVCTSWLSTLNETIPPPSKPMGARVLKIEPATACSRELILHAAPVSLAHHQLDSETDSGCWPELATSGRLCCVLHWRDARLNQGMFPLCWTLADSTYNSLLLEKSLQGGRGAWASASSVENNSLQWEVFAETKGWFKCYHYIFLFSGTKDLFL